MIDTIRIAGFRGIESLEIQFSRVSVLIGTNNSGKSSVLKALQLALGNYSRFVQNEDFHINRKNERAKEILVDVKIVPVNDKWEIVENFDDIWQSEFGDKISFSGAQTLIIRTRVINNETTGESQTERFIMSEWPALENWSQRQATEKKLQARFDSIQVFPVDAQRDIHQELRERSSYISRILGHIEYNDDDKTALEELIKEVNDQAVAKSNELENLRDHLNNLNRSFQGAGNTEITPFPKKLRDLSKYFSIHFGEDNATSFSMEYHGMGTRSWASMLTSKAFAEINIARHEQEAKPIANILLVEEPEAHLHPNAQKTLYSQLESFKGQVLVSSHSPYLAAMINVNDVRALMKNSSGISCNQVRYEMTLEERKILGREIWNKRGELLFAKGLILAEGITEEQVIPAMFKVFFDEPMYALGVTCISVGGKNYAPFLKLACSFRIPVLIVSDNDGNTEEELSNQFKNIKEQCDMDLFKEKFDIYVC
jgi:putative ATP-dependent endonuclease of OLD family